MSTPVNNLLSGDQGAEVDSITAQAAKNLSKSPGSSGTLNSKTMVPNNVASIPKQVIKAMEMGIAMDIINNMRRSQARIHETMLKARNPTN